MKLDTHTVDAHGIRLAIIENDIEVGRAFVYFMHNDLHDQPFALMEDVYINEGFRGKGLGSDLVHQVITLAQNANCYKLIATSRESRPKVHSLYQQLGFTQRGLEFRMDF